MRRERCRTGGSLRQVASEEVEDPAAGDGERGVVVACGGGTEEAGDGLISMMDNKKSEPAGSDFFRVGSVARSIQAAERLHNHLRLFLVYILTRAGHRVECEIRDLFRQELALADEALRGALEQRFPDAEVRLRETGRYIHAQVVGIVSPPHVDLEEIWPCAPDRAWRLAQDVTGDPGADPADGDLTVRRATHRAVDDAAQLLDAAKFNVVIAKTMELVNVVRKAIDSGCGPADPAVREAVEAVSTDQLELLASGSRGNATVVQAGQTRVLIDCGFAVREVYAGSPTDLRGRRGSTSSLRTNHQRTRLRSTTRGSRAIRPRRPRHVRSMRVRPRVGAWRRAAIPRTVPPEPRRAPIATTRSTTTSRAAHLQSALDLGFP